MPTTQSQLSPEFFATMQGKALEAFSVVADMNHRVLQGLVGLSAATAKEGLRTFAELQTATMESAMVDQAPHFGASSETIEVLRQNPFVWYQKGLLGVLEGTQKTYRLLEANSQVVTRSAERLQASADQTGQEIQEALNTSVSRLKEIYGRS
jgi:hypothetical protein